MKQQLRSALAVAALVVAVANPAAAQSVEERVTRLERVLESAALSGLSNQIVQLRQEVQQLRGQVEVLQRENAELKKRQRELYADIDGRLRKLETAAPSQPTPGSQPGGSQNEQAIQPPAATAPQGQAPASSAAQPPAAGELESYQAAFDLLKAGRYQQAGEAFRGFLERFPQGDYADNAYYWLGESHYVQRDFDAALPQFEKILEAYPNSPKRPDALLKLGFIKYEQGDMAQSRKYLERVTEEFPTSSAATLAEQRLQRMR